jgi:hypothetical protein
MKTSEVLSIERVTPQSAFDLRLDFNDSTTQVVNFLPFLSQSQHPEIRSFLDPQKFSHYRLEHGDLVWGDYELCFPIADLHENKL